MESPIVIEGLVKTYKGGFKAVDTLNLRVEKGAFMGFLGPNGAGKTTTIKIMTNLLSTTSGRTLLNGVDAMKDPKRALADVGAVVETPEFYPFLTPVETLEYLGRLRGMSKDHLSTRIDEVLKLVNMQEFKDKRIGEFSKGMKQRIAIAQAALHEPSLIILDEPTSGLDPLGMFEVREVLRGLKTAGYTIFMSSHLLNEVQEVCTDIALINRGKLLRSGKVVDLLQEVRSKKIEVKVTNRLEPRTLSDIAALTGVNDLQSVGENMFSLNLEGDDEMQARVLLDLQSLGLRIVYFRESGLALESLYRSLITDSR
jgi:ABC-2 type transport system ATP-binding protein